MTEELKYNKNKTLYGFPYTTGLIPNPDNDEIYMSLPIGLSPKIHKQHYDLNRFIITFTYDGDKIKYYQFK